MAWPVTGSRPLAWASELASALAALTEHEREALLLVAWDELSATDAARVAGCSAAAFRVRLHRARQRVADQLGPRRGRQHARD